MKYNPFSYIHSEKDILKLVQTIMANTKGEGEKAGEDFWVKAEKLYYTALIAYIYYEAPKEEKNFATLLDMIDASEVREDDENYKNPIDRLFEALEKKEPRHFAVKQYKKYKLAAGVIELRRTLHHNFSERCFAYFFLLKNMQAKIIYPTSFISPMMESAGRSSIVRDLWQ